MFARRDVQRRRSSESLLRLFLFLALLLAFAFRCTGRLRGRCLGPSAPLRRCRRVLRRGATLGLPALRLRRLLRTLLALRTRLLLCLRRALVARFGPGATLTAGSRTLGT